MPAQHRARRRAVFLTYKRYVEADRAWNAAVQEASRWIPGQETTHLAILGNPGSQVRNLYAERERTMLRLNVALQKLKSAQRRAQEVKLKARNKRLLISFVHG